MVNNVVLYYNTGFNASNIPDSPDVLNNAFHREIEGHWDYQDFFLNSLQLKINWGLINNVDYIKFGNAYYFVDGIKMINENNAEVYLTLDALTSMGGVKNLDYITGIITRAHAKTDDMFSNNVDEPVGCSEALEITATDTIGPPNNNNMKAVVVSTVNLEAELNSDTYKESISFSSQLGTETGSVSIPKAPPISQTTDIEYIGPDETVYTEGGVGKAPLGYYNFNTDICKRNIDFLRSYGLETAALYAYCIPEYYINATSGGNTFFSKISNGVPITHATQSFKGGYPEGIKNNKTYSMYNYYIVRSNTSGDMKEYDSCDLGLNNVSEAPEFMITADVQYKGRPYCTPKRYRGSVINNPTYESVKGLEWYDIPIAYTQMSGSQLYENQYRTNVAGLGVQTANLFWNTLGSSIPSQGTFKGVGESYKDEYGHTVHDPMSTGAASYGTGMIQNLMTTKAKANTLIYKAEKTDIEYAENKVVAPELSTSPVLGLQRVLPNNFTIYHVKPTNADVLQIDKFFTWYGYAQPNIVFDKSYITGRQYFNYIKCSNTKILRNSSSDPYGLGVKTMGEAQLNNGVRIWHTLPTDVDSNPIV